MHACVIAVLYTINCLSFLHPFISQCCTGLPEPEAAGRGGQAAVPERCGLLPPEPAVAAADGGL